MVEVVSPLLLPLPTKTSSLSCEAFSISSKFDQSIVEGKQRWAWCWTQGGRPRRRSLRLTLTPWKRCYALGQHLLPLPQNKLFVKFGPRRETMKEIIEADNDHWGYDSGQHLLQLPLKVIIFQLMIDQSFKLIEKALKIKKRFLKVVGVVSPLLLPLPTKTSSLSCEAFSISSKFDW